MFFLIIGFVITYAGSFLYIFFLPETHSVSFAYGMLLMGGGAFVYMVTRYALNSILLLEFQATHDRITNLKNRYSFTTAIERLVDKNMSFYVMLIDLNNFKQFNNAFGHSFGDELLKQISDRMSQALPKHCRLYRVVGDEFAIIGKGDDNHQLDTDLKTVQNLFSQPISVQGQNLIVGIGIGISTYPVALHDPEELIQQAEQALHFSKTSKGNWKIFSEELNKDIQEHLEIVNKLQKAIKNEAFSLHYQPIIDTSTQLMHGAEVLIRWKQEDGSYIPPDKFIPIAEQSTMIHDITCWVVKRALSDLVSLSSNGFTGSLHINLSAKDLHNNKLLSCLKRYVDEEKIDPKRLIFEITESAMMTDIKQAAMIMHQLSKIGYAFSLDDFGTGYSSFSLLKDLPLTQLKIDRSFVSDMHTNTSNHSIVRSMVFLAKSLNYTVVAEGVEDAETTHLLHEMECDFVQGYLFSKPLVLDDYIKLSHKVPLAV